MQGTDLKFRTCLGPVVHHWSCIWRGTSRTLNLPTFCGRAKGVKPKLHNDDTTPVVVGLRVPDIYLTCIAGECAVQAGTTLPSRPMSMPWCAGTLNTLLGRLGYERRVGVSGPSVSCSPEYGKKHERG